MIISEKQIMQLMTVAQGYIDLVGSDNQELINPVIDLLHKIQNQQSEELKVVE